MPVFRAGKVFTLGASVRNNYTHKADFDYGFGNHLNSREQAVEVVRAFYKHLQLASTLAVGGDEAVGHLEVVVVRDIVGWIFSHYRRDNFSSRQGRPIMNGHNPDQIIRIFDHHRSKPVAVIDNAGHVFDYSLVVAAERQVIDALFGNYDELGQIDGVSSFTQNLSLRSALTAVGQKLDDVLKVIGSGV